MKANPSERWKNEIMDVVENHDFKYVEVYDAGRTFRQDDHQCDFCGSHLRWTAVIEAEDDPELNYSIGLDCLEHAMGTRWSRLQEVERDIKELKAQAKAKRRKEAYAEEYGPLISWLEKRLDLKYNSFLSDMLEILKTGNREFTRNMEEAVRRTYNNTDLDELKKKFELREMEKEAVQPKVERALELVAEIDDIEINDEYERQDGNDFKRDTYRFVKSVYDFLLDRGFITDKQKGVLNNIYQEYKEKEEKLEVA